MNGGPILVEVQELPAPGSSAEAAIVAQAIHDRAAFAPLYARYLDRVYRYCYRRLGTREAAEDATSQTFERAIDRLESFRGGSFPAWLFTIARNVVTAMGRRHRPTAPLDAAGDPPDQAQRQRRRRCLPRRVARYGHCCKNCHRTSAPPSNSASPG